MAKSSRAVENLLMSTRPHRRYNLLTGEWILVSPHRAERPWLGQEEDITPRAIPAYDPDCYLCPGNGRAGGIQNPAYKSTYVFDNDFPALVPDIGDMRRNDGDLLMADAESGVCRVICFSPRHDLTLPEMSLRSIQDIVDVWADQYSELARMPGINHVQIFENKGNAMGASNPHPHCQIWAGRSIPTEPAKELISFKEYTKNKKRCLLCDYLDLELHRDERCVVSNNSFVVVVPFWAMWPFETLLLPRRHVSNLAELTRDECRDLANILKHLTIRYDNLFRTPFPYSMGFHQQPTDGRKYPEAHLHAHFYPPLLRSAAVRKFMVGFEMLGEPQRDLTAETSAQRLRCLSENHYKKINPRRMDNDDA